ncbi:phosphoribosylanthranilate isomerase [Leucobacter sp. CSA1]|uniref:N-(5'-phosphoribosyl)anthranilate isomerase n=1 Tax=Leucobacter chromiisoli TaxID=2796471 RepID=A0A934Q892_9MICO|nr:phosphoribosylanthranilate isomerase [Leucobacter chromiisoli]MBK0418479.1 phosphoribosylanthranilate isomerase [Leucobacter chromiisoli]
MFVKICGLTAPETAETAVGLGADAIGMVMSRTSVRRIDPGTVASIVEAVGDRAEKVLVVHDVPAREAALAAARLGVDVLQMHGPYGREDFAEARKAFPRIWRATSLARDPEVRAGDWGEELLLLDGARAGSGERWDITGLRGLELGERWLLAGGLDPDNVAEAIATVRPWGVDVSSGVESAPGVKSVELIERFIANARAA